MREDRKNSQNEPLMDLTSLRDYIETLPDWVWQVDSSFRYVYTNMAALELTGYTPIELVTHTMFDLVPHNEKELCIEMFSHHDPLITSVRRLISVCRKDGSCRTHEVIASPIFDQKDKLIGYRGINRDVTEQKRVERALQESEQRFRDLADKSPIPVYLRVDGVAKYVNQSFADMYGYTIDELLGQDRLQDLVHPDDFAETQKDAIYRLTKNQGTRTKWNFRGITKSGETIYVETYSTITSYESRPAVIGTSIDVTEHRKIEEELRIYRDSLENLVEERTAQLNEANARLREDITKREEIEKALELKSDSLQELNTALKVLLRQREEDKKELEQRVVSNVRDLTFRYIQMLRETRLEGNQLALLAILEDNLNNIISPFSQKVSNYRFTPKEMEIVALMKIGRTTKQIAQQLNVCIDAVSRHKYHIRKKLGLNKEKISLRSHLSTLG